MEGPVWGVGDEDGSEFKNEEDHDPALQELNAV